MATGEPFFHATGESKDARRCNGIGTGTFHDGASLIADASSINGSTSIQCGNAGALGRGSLHWTGYNNTPGTAAISMGVRIKFRDVANPQGIFATAGPFRNLYNWLDINLGGATVNLDARNDLAQTCINNNWSHSFSTGTWYDLLWTWDGTTGANQVKLWLDGVNVTSYTASRINQVDDANVRAFIVLGITENGYNADHDIDEVFIYDSVIDPTSVTFRDGTSGSLNGSARTKYLFSSVYEGGAAGGRIIKGL